MGRDDYRYDDDRPRRRRRGRDEDRDRNPPKKPRSAAVGVLSVVNFVVGPLVMMFGTCTGFCSNILPKVQQHFLGIPGGLGDSNLATVTASVVIFLWGAGVVVTAIGLYYRGAWGRLLALIMGGCACPVGLLYFTLSILFIIVGTPDTDEARAMHVVQALALAVFFLGYGTWTYIVLLDPKRAQEFR